MQEIEAIQHIPEHTNIVRYFRAWQVNPTALVRPPRDRDLCVLAGRAALLCTDGAMHWWLIHTWRLHGSACGEQVEP